MKHFIFILLTTLIFPNVVNNGAEVTIPNNVSVTISGDLTLNSGDFIVDGILSVSGNIIYNGGIIIGDGLINNLQLNAGDLTQDGNIDIQDIVALVSIVVSDEYYNNPEDYYNPNGDIITDGTLNVIDVVNLVQIVLNR